MFVERERGNVGGIINRMKESSIFVEKERGNVGGIINSFKES